MVQCFGIVPPVLLLGSRKVEVFGPFATRNRRSAALSVRQVLKTSVHCGKFECIAWTVIAFLRDIPEDKHVNNENEHHCQAVTDLRYLLFAI